MHSYFIVGVLLFCHNYLGDDMTAYVDKLCRLGIPACSAVMIVQDFLKNFGTIALDEYIEELENETDNIIVGSEILEELKKRKVKKKSIK